MFTYIRLFSAISFIVIVLAALGVGMYFRMTAGNDFKMVVEQNNVSLAQGFTNTTWRRYQKLFNDILKDTPVSNWPQDQRFVQFSRESFRYFEGIPIAKLNIYTPESERFLSTDQSEIIEFPSWFGKLVSGSTTQDEAMQAVRQGKIISRVIPDGGFKAPDGSLKRGSLVQTFIPIISETFVPVVADNSEPKVEGFIEVFFDITPQWQQLYQFQLVGTSGIIVIFIALFAALILTSRRAEAIIAKQHDKTLELTAAKARAEAENMEKSRFLANISHELRTPLNAIIGFSDIIKTQSLGPVGNAQYLEYITDIHTSGNHLLSLINDILDFSKAEAGKLELEVSDVDATKLIRTCIRLVQPRAEQAQVNLLEELPKEHCVIRTDAKKLKQILLNLLSNAVKFTPVNGSVTVKAWFSLVDNRLTIEVIDTGIGIAPKDISKAMSPFGQVDSELSRKYEGTGLGLPLTKKFTEIMGGTFQIQSELGKGTTIILSLPREAPAEVIKKGSNTSKPQTESQPEPQPESGATPIAAMPAAALTLAAAPEPAFSTPPSPTLEIATASPMAPAFSAPPEPSPAFGTQEPTLSGAPAASPAFTGTPEPSPIFAFGTEQAAHTTPEQAPATHELAAPETAPLETGNPFGAATPHIASSQTTAPAPTQPAPLATLDAFPAAPSFAPPAPAIAPYTPEPQPASYQAPEALAPTAQIPEPLAFASPSIMPTAEPSIPAAITPLSLALETPETSAPAPLATLDAFPPAPEPLALAPQPTTPHQPAATTPEEPPPSEEPPTTYGSGT